MWNVQYWETPGWHSTDMIPTFYNPMCNPDTLLGSLFSPPMAVVIRDVSSGMQSYFVSPALEAMRRLVPSFRIIR